MKFLRAAFDALVGVVLITACATAVGTLVVGAAFLWMNIKW